MQSATTAPAVKITAPTRSRLEGHALAAALTDGYVAGLLAGAVIFVVGAVVAICTVNARISAAEAAPH